MQPSIFLLTLSCLASASSVLRARQDITETLTSAFEEESQAEQTEARQPVSPTPNRFFGVTLNMNLAQKGQRRFFAQAPVELNRLAQYSVLASEIFFDPSTTVGVDVRTVACQAFSDAEGIVPIDEEFSFEEPLELAEEGEELVQVGSVLCYVSGDLVEDAEEEEEEEEEEED